MADRDALMALLARSQPAPTGSPLQRAQGSLGPGSLLQQLAGAGGRGIQALTNLGFGAAPRDPAAQFLAEMTGAQPLADSLQRLAQPGNTGDPRIGLNMGDMKIGVVDPFSRPKTQALAKIPDQFGRNVDIPLGVSRKPVIDQSLESLSDDVFDARRLQATRKLDHLEKQFDEMTSDPPPAFKRLLAKHQDEFDAFDNERFRRDMANLAQTSGRPDIDQEGMNMIAAELRRLNFNLDMDKVRAVQIMRVLRDSGRTKQFVQAIRNIAGRSPDHMEIMLGKISDMNKLAKELGVEPLTVKVLGGGG